MKDKSKNTRIKLLKDEIMQSISSLEQWIKIDMEKYKSTTIEAKYLLSKLRTIQNAKLKEEYTLNLNFTELTWLCNIVAEHCLQHGENKIIGRLICEKLENILRVNYRLRMMDLCYPVNQWNGYKFG